MRTNKITGVYTGNSFNELSSLGMASKSTIEYKIYETAFVGGLYDIYLLKEYDFEWISKVNRPIVTGFKLIAEKATEPSIEAKRRFKIR